MSATARFWKFHADNPHVYDELVKLAKEARKAGRDRLSIGMLWEVLRWHYFLKTTDTDFKLNDHHCPFYARLIMDRNEELDGLFSVRASEADAMYDDEEAAA